MHHSPEMLLTTAAGGDPQSWALTSLSNSLSPGVSDVAHGVGSSPEGCVPRTLSRAPGQACSKFSMSTPRCTSCHQDPELAARAQDPDQLLRPYEETLTKARGPGHTDQTRALEAVA